MHREAASSALTDILLMQQAVGLGPDAHRDRPEDREAVSSMEIIARRDHTKNAVGSFIQFEDPATGDILYRKA